MVFQEGIIRFDRRVVKEDVNIGRIRVFLEKPVKDKFKVVLGRFKNWICKAYIIRVLAHAFHTIDILPEDNCSTVANILRVLHVFY